MSWSSTEDEHYRCSRRPIAISSAFVLVISCIIVSNIIVVNALSPGSQLSLCECMEARGSPNGLSCDKDGWFIIGFQHSGTWGGDSGGVLPLSRAICCRPCVPPTIDQSDDDPNPYQDTSYHRKMDMGSRGVGKRSGSPSPQATLSPDDDNNHDPPTNKSYAVAIVRQVPSPASFLSLHCP